MSPMVTGTTDNAPDQDFHPGESAATAPVEDEDGLPFWEFAARGELRVQSCAACALPRFPPRPCCPRCQCFASEWRRVSGHGRLWSYVVPHPPLLPFYEQHAPYNVALVELAEDPRIRLVGNVVAAPGAGLGSLDPARLSIGAPVRAAFTDPAEGVTVPYWLLEEA
ncbi:Zn-ribbon domain-containing OB-fold protein [Streptomyces gamaensis]|uniref:Zn-ribbon domain-containing OB-fold protein n=1 Tax=Streptomyces gamaensis TaxID=1763542 RepID=A0ABW0Z5B1_9ACTN